MAIPADEPTMFSNGQTCPKCNTDSLHRSHRRGRDWFFNLIGFPRAAPGAPGASTPTDAPSSSTDGPDSAKLDRT